VNDLQSTCDPRGLRIVGAIDFGSSVFPISSDGRINVERTWSGSDKDGDAEWTNSYWKITGFFDNPTTVSGSIIWRGELNWRGTHYRCASDSHRAVGPADGSASHSQRKVKGKP
jgi:hypothetical protein